MVNQENAPASSTVPSPSTGLRSSAKAEFNKRPKSLGDSKTSTLLGSKFPYLYHTLPTFLILQTQTLTGRCPQVFSSPL